MKLIRPAAIDDAALTSTNVVEAAPTAYNAGTTYALGATVSVASGTARAIYTSLANANTGHTPASSPTWWRHSGDTYVTYAGGSTYTLGDIVIDPAGHRTYESLQAGNTGHALNDAIWWLDLGATNRWKMFDVSVASQTTNPDSIEVTIAAPGRVDSVALLNLDAATARITMTDAVEGTVYDETYSLVSDSGISDWYAYFFEPIERRTNLAVTDLPPYANAAISIQLAQSGTVRCGVCIVGLTKDIGDTAAGARTGIQDYSVKQADEFGNYTIRERAFSKRGSFTVLVENTFVDQLVEMLGAYRAKPTVYVGADNFSSTVIYGFFRDFSVEIALPNHSYCSLEIEGLT